MLHVSSTDMGALRWKMKWWSEPPRRSITTMRRPSLKHVPKNWQMQGWRTLARIAASCSRSSRLDGSFITLTATAMPSHFPSKLSPQARRAEPNNKCRE